jgi:3-methyladenine DNA glycosylase Tag
VSQVFGSFKKTIANTIEHRSQNTQAYAARQAVTATEASTSPSRAAKATMTATSRTIDDIAHPAPIVPPPLAAAPSAQHQKQK